MFSRVLNRLRSFACKDQQKSEPFTYNFGDIAIKLPSEHLLPVYQSEHKLYDRFLPHLAKYLTPGDLIIDVGANCGDTLAAMANANPELDFICVEPDSDFYAYLEKNAAEIRRHLPAISIKLVQAVISASNKAVGLTGSKGTRTRDDSSSSGQQYQSRILQEIIPGRSAASKLRLIKSDVDGYDYDVIASAGERLNDDKLMLFFECMYDENFQRENFIDLIGRLPASGFSDYWLFDNYGNFMLHTSTKDAVIQLIDYIWRENQGKSTRSVYYLDILASKPVDHRFVSELVRDYTLNAG